MFGCVKLPGVDAFTAVSQTPPHPTPVRPTPTAFHKMYACVCACVCVPVCAPPTCRALESQDLSGAVEAYTAALAVDPQHKQVNKQLQLGLCKVQQQLGKAEEAVQVRNLQGCCSSSIPWQMGVYRVD